LYRLTPFEYSILSPLLVCVAFISYLSIGQVFTNNLTGG
jgi:hypothetical protein